MNAAKWITSLAVATTCCLLTVSLFWPAPLTANEEKPATQIARPRLNVDGIVAEIRPVEAEDQAFPRKFLLQVTNQGDQPREVEWNLNLTTREVESALRVSRMGPIEMQAWEQQVAVKVEPGETKTVEVETQYAADDATSVRLYISNGQSSIIGWERAGKSPEQQIGQVQMRPAVEMPNHFVNGPNPNVNQ
ncbi:MAG: hypothetical protein ACLFUJ_07315 [Phycisphaerae bacterium]